MDARELPFVGREAELAAIAAYGVDADLAGVLVVGACGTGKTRLARQAVAALGDAGWRVEWVTASRSATSIPFGALAHLWPRDWWLGGQPVSVVRAIEKHVRATRTVLCVDDAHLLDGASATVLGHLAVSRAAFMVLTAAADEPLSDALGAFRRLDLPDLAAGDVDRLLEYTLGAEIDGVSRRRLHRAAGGNPLALREVLRAGLAGCTLRQRYGVWTWDDRLPSGFPADVGWSVSNRAAVRLRTLAPPVRLVLELVALGEPLPLATVDRIADSMAVQVAEDEGLIIVERTGARAQVRLAHPFFGAALRAGLSIPRARRAHRRLAATALAMPLRRAGDVLRVAGWQVAGELITDAGVVAAGAGQALRRGDLDLAERLARAARGAAPGPGADQRLAQVLCARGRAAEAAALVPAQPPPDGTFVGWAVTRAAAGYLSTGDAAATDVLQRQAAGPDADLADAARAGILLLDGRCAEAYALAGRVLDRPVAGDGANNMAGDTAALVASTVATVAAGFLGQGAEALRLHQRGLELVGYGDAGGLWRATLLGYASCLAQLAAGELHLAADLAEVGHRNAIEAETPVPAAGWAALRGLVAAGQGHLGSAVPALREAAALLDHNDPIGVVRLSLTCLGAVVALAGDAPAGRAWLDQADRRTGHVACLFTPWAEQWRAWVLAAGGSVTAAVPVAARAARLARAAGLPTVEASALFDVVRLGGKVPARLGTLASGLDTPLAAALASAAGGLVNADGDALARATETFALLGHDLLAAESATAAGQAYRRIGRRGSAQVYTEQAAMLRARCGDVRTPLLNVDSVTELLTPREREVLLLAANHTSPDIADRLGLSPRTVTNNLARAYAKLGVSGRTELRALLGHVPARAPQGRAGRPG